MKEDILECYASAKLICPICAAPLGLRGGSLVCNAGHCFDISAKGYVNFSGNTATRYGRELFLARRRVFEAGLYNKAADALAELARGTCLDAGCGEGWFTAFLGDDAYGLDISKEAVAMAAGRGRARWLVGDIARLPLADSSVDTVVNVLSPASYSEFSRVLKPDGRVIKIVPCGRYLEELRRLAGMGAYEDGLPEARMAERLTVTERRRITETHAVTPTLAADILAMSPLTFGRDMAAIDPAALTEITVDLEVIIGK